jgi:type 1 glutamine amidotransferase
MKLFSRLLGSILVAQLLLAAANGFAAEPAAVKKVLFFSKSAGYEHSVIKRAEGQTSWAEKVLLELGEKNHIEFTFSKDGRLFTPENIAKYDAFFFYTTGVLTEKGTDGNPPMSEEGKAAFLQAIKDGKGFIGTHSATDTFHSPNYKAGGAGRFKNDGDDMDPYIRMIGGEFILHGSQQKARMIVADAKFPGISAVPDGFGPQEEWYSLKNFAPDLHVLLAQDTSTMTRTGGGNHAYDRAPYPATWAHHYGKGRVFYTSMGHREDVWTNPVFQQVLMGGISWAVGNVDANVTPNIETATPQASVLPSAE